MSQIVLLRELLLDTVSGGRFTPQTIMTKSPFAIVAATLALLCSTIGLSVAGIPYITSTDYTAVPVGETITFTGAGFIDTTDVSFIWYEETPATFNVVSDQTLEVVFPTPQQTGREHFVVIETATGSTVSLESVDQWDLFEFTGNGPDTSFARYIIVKAGAVLTDLPFGPYEFVYVEAGGVLQNISGGDVGHIFAEDGATLDFRNVDFSMFFEVPMVYYSTNTTVLGALPTPDPWIGQGGSKQVTPLSLSRDIGYFTDGYEVNVTIVGQGTVTSNPPGPFFESYTNPSFTAVPAAGYIFAGWSGASNSSNATTTISTGNSGGSLTATFSQGYNLETYTGSGGTITTSPNLASYPPGTTVNLSATPAAGFEFLGWGGQASGSLASTSVTMNSSKEAVAMFRRLDHNSLPQITSADFLAVPHGEKITLSGTGLSTTQQAFFNRNDQLKSATPTVIGQTVELVMPSDVTSGRDHNVLVETATGSTVTVDTQTDYLEFSGVGTTNGTLPSGAEAVTIVVKAGAILTLDDLFLIAETIYVEAGGVIKGLPDLFLGTIYAESGATLDFRTVNFSNLLEQPLVVHSPETEILGGLPSAAGRQITPLTLSPDIGPFTNAVHINITTVGNGTVTVNPNSIYARASESVTFTAVPGTGALFSGWSGASSSGNTATTVYAGSTDINLTATFSNGFTLETFGGLGGTVTATPALASYTSGQVISLNASAAPGYQFLGWGGDLLGTSTTTTPLTMDGNKVVTGIFRKSNYGTLPIITSVDHEVIPVGGTISMTGNGFADTTDVDFVRNGEYPSAFNAVSDSLLEVIFPQPWQSGRDHFVLVQTATGSTVSLPDPSLVLEFQGVGNLPLIPSQKEWLVVKAGSVLESLDGIYPLVYVEAGAVLKDRYFDAVIVAEDGATVDFRNLDPLSPAPIQIYHSPETNILGTVPNPVDPLDPLSGFVTQIPSVRLSGGIGPFTDGCPLNITIDGPGSVTVSPIKTYYRSDESIAITATPDAGMFFVRWAGLISSTQPSRNISVGGSNCSLIARFSAQPEFFSVWRPLYFTPAELADPAIVGLNADPDGDGITNAAEYAFGSDPTEPNADGAIGISYGGLTASALTIYLDYKRPKNAADIEYQVLVSQGLNNNWQDGSGTAFPFTWVEQTTTDLGNNIEEVRVAVSLPSGSPKGLFFRVTANIEDIP